MTVNADLPIRIALAARDLRQGRLYLTPDGTTDLDIDIAAAGGSAVELKAGDRLSLDFGQLRLNAADEDSLRFPNWTGIATPERLSFDLASDRALTDQGMRLHVKIPSLAGPFPKPLGTLFVTLERQGRLLGMTEVEQSLTGGRPSSPTMPPILVRWEGDQTPELVLSKSHRLALTIVNVRRTRRGTVKALSTMARDLMNCRVRLTFVPAYRQGRLATMIGADARFTVSARLMSSVSGRVEPEWVAEKLSNDTWDVSPPKQDARVLGEEDGLRIVLDDVSPQELGGFALCVTLFDLPGYPQASWSLPVTVRTGVEIVEFGGRLAPGEPGMAELWWHLRSGGHALQLEIRGSEGQYAKINAQAVGHLDMPIKETTSFTMKALKTDPVGAVRATTIFVSQKRDFVNRVKVSDYLKDRFANALYINRTKIYLDYFYDEIITAFIEFHDGKGARRIEDKFIGKTHNSYFVCMNLYQIAGKKIEITDMIRNYERIYNTYVNPLNYEESKKKKENIKNEINKLNIAVNNHIRSKIKNIYISIMWGKYNEIINIDIPDILLQYENNLLRF